VWVYRFVVGILVAAIAAVSIVPLLVLLDLAGGGDGWGICPDGCATSYFQGPELVFVLLLVLFALLGVLRFVVVVHRWWSSRRRRVSVQG
jgi:hypothetical protein